MKQYLTPAMDIIAIDSTAALMQASVPTLGGTLGSGDDILAPGMGELPPGVGDDIVNSILPPGIGKNIIFD